MKQGTASVTAMRMALTKVAAARDRVLRPVVADPDEPYSEWFVRAHSSEARVQLALWKIAPLRQILYSLSDKVIAGSFLHILVRKRYIEDQVRAALEGGIRQVVIFGAGLDPLALRLEKEFPETVFFEVDHPATQAVKKAALEQHGVRPERVHMRPGDLEKQPVNEAVAALPGFRSGEATLFLAEGLLMYLEQSAVDATFAAVRRHSGPGSQFIFSVLDKGELEDRDSGIGRSATLLERIGEAIRSSIDRKRLDDFLRHRGFKRRAVGDHKTFRTTYLDPLGIQRPLLEGEFVVVAEPTHPGR